MLVLEIQLCVAELSNCRIYGRIARKDAGGYTGIHVGISLLQRRRKDENRMV